MLSKHSLPLLGFLLIIGLLTVVVYASAPGILTEPTATHYKITPDPTSPPTKVPEVTWTPQVKASDTPDVGVTPLILPTPTASDTPTIIIDPITETPTTPTTTTTPTNTQAAPPVDHTPGSEPIITPTPNPLMKG